jgi:hypothetical protein
LSNGTALAQKRILGSNSRIAFWDDASETITIYDPNHVDLGTSFKPQEDLGKTYFYQRFK